ncbi:helix-turn-helix domain-containing protein [Wielerella bovis]|uniref:helix-turn-helix domain-containing protein n=1 Tax=Wielerella bovis TaxID=2917790 RepID=UPI00201905AA|nr:helix-turn-helix transcriptional regulator [Wielerella bovis]ULJ65734.1 helix-turn-helix transcriptional regulator [Wielerella bovis]ULJ66223.1 helix-turn-helix transcriptional regulator [Wielerella bovis]
MSAKLQAPTALPNADDLRDVLAYNIRLFRVNKGWSQEELARQCGLDRTYVSAIERKRWNVALSNIEKMALALGVAPYQLLLPPNARLALLKLG